MESDFISKIGNGGKVAISIQSPSEKPSNLSDGYHSHVSPCIPCDKQCLIFPY
jgi:hypothetical protein